MYVANYTVLMCLTTDNETTSVEIHIQNFDILNTII